MSDYGDISEQQSPDAIARQVEEADVRSFVAGYLTCAVWASTEGEEGTPIEELGYTADDLTLEAQAQAEDDCREFLTANVRALIARAIDPHGPVAGSHPLVRGLPAPGAAPYSYEQAGHDFWLTRNHHGAGFWDRGLGQVGERLTEEAQAHGSADLILVADA